MGSGDFMTAVAAHSVTTDLGLGSQRFSRGARGAAESRDDCVSLRSKGTPRPPRLRVNLLQFPTPSKLFTRAGRDVRISKQLLNIGLQTPSWMFPKQISGTSQTKHFFQAFLTHYPLCSTPPVC